jgi:LysR family D-serine deaminase transcriptional activator
VETVMSDVNEARNRLLNGWQLSKMYTFEVAARHESFALAAEELSLSPSAVSHRINLLEEELGIQLFVRSHRKVELTPEGKRVWWTLKSSLDTLNQEILDIKNQALSGTLTVYSRPSIAQCWLVPMLGDFTRRYPSISLTILTGNDYVNMQRTGVDLALYFDDTPPNHLSHHFLMDEAILPVCSPEYATNMRCYRIPITCVTARCCMTVRPGAMIPVRMSGVAGRKFCGEYAAIIGYWFRSFRFSDYCSNEPCRGGDGA